MPAPSSAQLYRRFPGAGRYLLNRVRLYVGPDHLLQVTATGYSESYRRFFFRDIQVISLHKTIGGAIWNLVWGAFLFLFVGLTMSTGPDAMPFWAVVAGIMALLLGVNIARGPTCACHIQTAVQQQRLYSLNRVRRARRLIERIKPLLIATQQPPPPMTPDPTTEAAPVTLEAPPVIESSPAPPPPEAS